LLTIVVPAEFTAYQVENSMRNTGLLSQAFGCEKNADFGLDNS
jgi:hypothetical protein